MQLITWGHPNLGRGFREHQLNVFAASFLPIGFTFKHKQTILEEFAAHDAEQSPRAHYEPCPGQRPLRGGKPADDGENKAERLDARLVGQHYDAYWQICRALGCPRRPENVKE